jgi:hypothetical protein
MNATQKTILVLTLIIMAAMILFPPWNARLGSGGHYLRSYGFITQGPQEWMNDKGQQRVNAYVDYERLAAQIGICAVVSGILILLLASKKKS